MVREAEDLTMSRQAALSDSPRRGRSISLRRSLLQISIALPVQMIAALGANADPTWQRYPTDDEIARLEKDAVAICRQRLSRVYEREMANAVVRSTSIKRHEKSIVEPKSIYDLQAGPMFASDLTLVVLFYWQTNFKPPLTWHSELCESHATFKSGEFYAPDPRIQAYSRDFTEPPEARETFAVRFKNPENWLKSHHTESWKYADAGFAPLAPPNIKVCPPLPKSEAVGLIAANDGARAAISYSGKPKKEVLAIAETDVPGLTVQLASHQFLHRDHSKANFANTDRNNPLRVTTDSSGQAQVLARLRVQYWPENTNRPPALTKPGTVRVLLREEGAKDKEVSAEIKVGLGLTLETAQMINVSGSIDEPPQPQHVWRTVVKSRFFPELDMVEYWDSHVCDAGLPLPYANVQSIALNFEERGEPSSFFSSLLGQSKGSPLTDGVGGAEEDIPPGSEFRKEVGQVYGFGRDPVGKIYLKPIMQGRKRGPVYSKDKNVYPAVTQLRNGQFAKGYFGFVKIAEQGQPVLVSQASLEPRLLNGTPYVFTMDQPDSWYTSAVCSTEAKDIGQVFCLSILGLAPGIIGEGVDLGLGFMSGLCAVSKGNYKDGLTAVGYAVGKAAFGRLVKKSAIPKMTQGNWSPKFYRYLGIDSADISPNEGKAFAEALETAYDLAVRELELNNWTLPAAVPKWPSPPASGATPPPSPKPRWPGPSSR
jgi:hypothetical protein